MAERIGPRGIVRGRPFAVHDLGATPAGCNRYELLGGTLLGTPAPGTAHRKVVLRLGALPDAECPDELEVLPAPFAVRASVTTELQPDLLVARDEDLTGANLPAPPVLAVEVLSPSTKLRPELEEGRLRTARRAELLGGRSGRAAA